MPRSTQLVWRSAMMRARRLWSLMAVVVLLVATTSASAAPIFFGPLPYLSAANIPPNFYAGGPVVLENFEDGILDSSITASAGGKVIPPDFPLYIDSVDLDDGTKDGSGSGGHSWFVTSGSTGVKFTFTGPSYPTAAGLVWTDGYRDGSVSFKAYGPVGTLLGTWGTFILGDNSYAGGTAEDRFFGVLNQGGISAIELIGDGRAGMEVDHVQYGYAVPEPASLFLLGVGLVGAAGLARHRRRR